jgi:hypothetical protein
LFFFFGSLFFFSKFPLGKTGWVALRIIHPTGSTVGGDFRARSAGEVKRMLR